VQRRLHAGGSEKPSRATEASVVAREKVNGIGSFFSFFAVVVDGSSPSLSSL
jgi:hypothetical protein